MKSLKNEDGFSPLHTLLVLVIVGIIGFTGWYVWNANQDATKTLNKANKETSSESNASRLDHQNDARYKITELKLAVSLNDKTTDLISKVSGSKIDFSLKSFLDEANAAKYSYIDPNGVNSCEKLVTIKVLKDAAEVRQQPTEVTGELIDTKGDPLEGRIIKLNDGRYALPSTNQGPCNGDASFDGSPLQDKDVAARSNILKVLQASLQSY
ncbi:MAG: hypothetical protein JWN82_383 [Candidatus Saccharibacteria bacterium]|nr:hypothetical protein [Candidatus Saccharibacteria bacterium]